MENPFKPTEKYKTETILITLVFAFIGIALFAYLDEKLDDPYLIASFGATAVLIYGAPKAPFSKPKNVFFGHLFSALIGVTFVVISKAAGIYDDYTWAVCGITVAVAIVSMMLTGTIHPPGGATALTCVLSCYDGYIFVIRPVMLGIICLMILAYAANYVRQKCA